MSKTVLLRKEISLWILKGDREKMCSVAVRCETGSTVMPLWLYVSLLFGLLSVSHGFLLVCLGEVRE